MRTSFQRMQHIDTEPIQWCLRADDGFIQQNHDLSAFSSISSKKNLIKIN